MAGKLRFIRGVLPFILCMFCAGMMLLLFGMRSSAASRAVIWDGKAAFEPGKIYVVTGSVSVSKKVIIPADTKLSIRDGGELRIYSQGELKVYGELAVAIGGYMKNSGILNIKQGAQFNVYGDVESSINGKVDISGDMTIFNRGSFKASSSIRIYKGAYILDKGALSFYKSSEVKLSGNITSTASSDLELRGIMSITLSGVIAVNGHLTVGAESNVKCSGKISLSKSSTYTRFKVVTVTKSGIFEDKRPEDEYKEMTVDILIDEPDVKLKGIDVSYAQGEIDWERVAASGVDFVIIRAGRGRAGADNTMKEDDRFRENMEGAKKYGIDVGVYFYSYATSVAEAREEAEFYVDIIKGYEIEYPVILDMEETFQGNIGKKKLTNMINTFFETVMDAGYFPMFYSYKAWIETYLDMTVLDKYAVWLAQVNDVVTYDGGYYIWQYSFSGKVSGINSDVDLNISYKDWPTILRKYRLNNLE